MFKSLRKSRERPIQQQLFGSNMKIKPDVEAASLGTISAKSLTKLSPKFIFTTLDSTLVNLIEHFGELSADHPSSTNSKPLFFNQEASSFKKHKKLTYSDYFTLLRHLKLVIDRSVEFYSQIESNAESYDFSSEFQVNGYRSLLKVFVSCSRRVLTLVLTLKKENYKLKSVLTARKMSRSFRKLETWTNLAEKLDIVLQIAVEMQRSTSTSDQKSLFLNAEALVDSEMERKMFDLATVHQDAFHGRTCGFQFCESLRLPLTCCAVAFSSCHEAYTKYVNKQQHVDLDGDNTALSNESEAEHSYEIGDFFHSILRSKKYAANPELRSRQMSHIVKTTGVDFCKAFWQLTETSLFQVVAFFLTLNKSKIVKHFKIC